MVVYRAYVTNPGSHLTGDQHTAGFFLVSEHGDYSKHFTTQDSTQIRTQHHPV